MWLWRIYLIRLISVCHCPCISFQSYPFLPCSLIWIDPQKDGSHIIVLTTAVAMAGAAVSPHSPVLCTCSTSFSNPPVSGAPIFRLRFSDPVACRRRISVVHSFWVSPSRRQQSLLCRSGLSFAASWHGRSHLGDLFWTDDGRQWQSRHGTAGTVHASLLGVGAPEALVIGVVALVVFGPKGLAEVARTLGKSLKAFQPTIQELQQVSKEFKSTLEQEIGLDELRNPKPPPTYQQQPPPQQQTPVQNPGLRTNRVDKSIVPQTVCMSGGSTGFHSGSGEDVIIDCVCQTDGSPDARAYTTEDYMRVTEEQAKALVPEDLRREAEAAAWGRSPPAQASAENLTKENETGERKPEDLS